MIVILDLQANQVVGAFRQCAGVSGNDLDAQHHLVTASALRASKNLHGYGSSNLNFAKR